jgi:phosphocarrier protein
LVQVANEYESTVMVEKNGVEANGKSIMGLLLLAATQGTEIIVKAEGPDALAALQAVGTLIDTKFGEQ